MWQYLIYSGVVVESAKPLNLLNPQFIVKLGPSILIVLFYIGIIAYIIIVKKIF